MPKKMGVKRLNSDELTLQQYRRLSVARDVLTGTGSPVCTCRLCRKYGAEYVSVNDLGKLKVGYGGIQHCGSIWACPMCSIQISRERRAKLSALAVRERSKGHGAALLTFTLQHGTTDRLADLLDVMTLSHKKMHSGAGWASFARSVNYVGSIRTIEINFGAHGWHPHYHELLITEHDLDQHDARLDTLNQRWRDCLAFNSGFADSEHGYKYRVGYGNVSDYLTKWGIVPELVNPGTKLPRTGGYSPFQLLDVVANNGKRAPWARRAFDEYVAGTKHVHQFHSSPVFGKDLKIDDVHEIEPFEPLALLTSDAWYQVWSNGWRGELLVAARAGFLHKWLSEHIHSI